MDPSRFLGGKDAQGISSRLLERESPKIPHENRRPEDSRSQLAGNLGFSLRFFAGRHHPPGLGSIS